MDRVAIRIILAKDMILDKAERKDKDVGTVADRPMPQSAGRPRALTTKRQELDAAKTQRLDRIMGQDPITDQGPDAVKVTVLAPAMVAGGKATQRRRSQVVIIRRNASR